MRLLPWFVFLAACNPSGLATSGGNDLGADGFVDGFAPDLGPRCERKDDVPARASLRIVVENRAAQPRFLAVPSKHLPAYQPYSPNCAGFAVRVPGATEALGIERGFTCECECPAPTAPHVDRYRKLDPGESFELDAWDGRALVDCVQQIDCATRGWQGIDHEDVLHAEPQPSGPYLVTVGFADTAPPECPSTNGVDHVCTTSGEPGTNGIAVTLPICKTARTASAEGTLAASGEATVVIGLD